MLLRASVTALLVTAVLAVAPQEARTSQNASGLVWNWGRIFDQPSPHDFFVPTGVDGLESAVEVTAGDSFSVALLADGTVWAWGVNDLRGQLGNGHPGSWSADPIQVKGVGGIGFLSGIASIAAGRFGHTLALRDDGSVVAWGRNSEGQVGDGTSIDRTTPVAVQGLPPIQTVAAGASHSLALANDGSVWAWGNNGSGQLGDGTTTRRHIPVPVPGLADQSVRALAAGNSFSVAVLTNGTVLAWGGNTSGQIGDGTTIGRITPVPVHGLDGVATVVSGSSHTLALRFDGTVWAWGENGTGALGDGTIVDGLLPSRVELPGVILDVGAGTSHSFAVTNDRTLLAWGGNSFGKLGDGTTTNQLLPVPVPELSNVLRATGGTFHSLAISDPEPLAFDLEVPRYMQGTQPYGDNEPSWENHIYDHGDIQDLTCGTTIADCGCAITAIAMMFAYHGIEAPGGDPTTPQTVNDYLRRGERRFVRCPRGTGIASNGYLCGGVNWWDVPGYSGGRVKLETAPPTQDGAFNFLADTVESDLRLGTGQPVIVKVPPTDSNGRSRQHWVVVSGIDGDSFSINDPNSAATSLGDTDQGYNDNFSEMKMARYHLIEETTTLEDQPLSLESARSVVTALQESSPGVTTASRYLVFGVVAPEEVLLQAPDGRKTGRLIGGPILQAIPSSGYGSDGFISPDVDVAPLASVNGSLTWLWVESPDHGTYRVQVSGSPDGDSSLAAYAIDDNGVTNLQVFNAHDVESQLTYLVRYDPANSDAPLAQEISVDIKPGNPDNVINCRNANGLITVALLSSRDFDATKVDPNSVSFAGAHEFHLIRGQHRRTHNEDLDSDGDIDAVFHFRFGETTLSCESTLATLKGVTDEAVPFEGSDTLTMSAGQQ